MKLTTATIGQLKCPADRKDLLVFDDEQAGLGIRVTVGGGKSYLVQYRHAGEKRRIPLGSYSAISLKAARKAAQAIMGDVAKGRDPAAERKEWARKAKEQAERKTLTLSALVGQWEELHLAGKRPGYAAEATRALRFAFAKQLKEPAAALEAKAVRRTINAIADAGKKATARLTMAYGRACYGWAAGRDLVATNPFEDVKAESVPARDRVASDDELRAVWRATEGLGAYRSLVRFLILTGQRRDEVAGITWARSLRPLDLDNSGVPSEERSCPHSASIGAGAGRSSGSAAATTRARRRRAGPCLFCPRRPVCRLEQGEGAARCERRYKLANSRPPPHVRYRTAETRRPPRGHRGSSQSRLWE